jgi:hypothetical protein
MSIAFSLAIYLVAGVAACAWLKSQARLPSGLAAHVTAILVWPAYLPVSLAAAPSGSSASAAGARLPPRDAAFESVRRQLRRMPLDATRRRDHVAVIDGLERAFTERRDEIARWRSARSRLTQLAAEVGGDGCAFAADECDRLDRAAGDAERDLARARESIVRLTLRLEVYELRTSHESLDAELRAFIEEIDALVGAREEADRVLTGDSPR